MSTAPNSIRLGVIGAGGRLRSVLRHVLGEASGRLRITAAYDPYTDSLAALRNDLGYDFTRASSEDAVVQDPEIDWVFIGSWNCFHARQAIAALRAGKNVFCEKPLATNLDDCLAIRYAAQKSGRTFAFGLVLRYSPVYQKVREVVASGILGEIISFEFNETLGFAHGGYIFGNWRRKSENAGSHLLEKCCHDLDLANWIIDSLPVTVASFGGRVFFLPANARHVERIGPDANGAPAYSGWADPQRVSPFSEGADIADNQVAILEYANGVRATFHTNCNSALPERRFHICGTEGALRADAYTGRIEWCRIGHDTKREEIDLGASGGHAGGDEMMARALVRCIFNGEAPLASVAEGLASAVTAFAIDRAMHERRVVDLRPVWQQCGVTLPQRARLMNNFTPRAQQVLALSRKEADRFDHNYVGTEHLLLGLLRLGQGVAVNVLMKLGLDLENVRNEVEKQVGRGEKKMSGNIPYTPRVKRVLALAGMEAKKLGHSYVGTEHILLGILKEGDGVSARVLRTLDVDIGRTRAEIIEELDPNLGGGSRYPERQQLGGTSPAENAFYLTRSVPAAEAKRSATPQPENPPHPALAPYLNPDEVLLWSGEPRKKFRFERKHLPLLLFLIPFCAFMFLPIFAILAPTPPIAPSADASQVRQVAPASPETPPQKQPPLAVRIFMAVFAFCFIGGIMAWILYCAGFSLGGNAFLQGKTIYGVTNHRVIIVAGSKSKTVRSIHLGSVTDLRMIQWPDGLGTISSGAESPWPYSKPSRGTNTLLENITDPAKVFKIMIDVRKLA